MCGQRRKLFLQESRYTYEYKRKCVKLCAPTNYHYEYLFLIINMKKGGRLYIYSPLGSDTDGNNKYLE